MCTSGDCICTGVCASLCVQYMCIATVIQCWFNSESVHQGQSDK